MKSLEQAAVLKKELDLCKLKWTKRIGWIYLIKFENYYKLGRTIDITKRLSTYRTTLPTTPKIIFCFKCRWYRNVENAIKRVYRDKRSGESYEWFVLTIREVDLIISLMERFGTEKNPVFRKY